MNRMCEMLVLSGIAGVLTLGLVSAEAKDTKGQRQVTVTSTETIAVERAEVGQAAAERIVQTSACGRKVKVVYAGYGEGDRAGCPVTAR